MVHTITTTKRMVIIIFHHDPVVWYGADLYVIYCSLALRVTGYPPPAVKLALLARQILSADQKREKDLEISGNTMRKYGSYRARLGFLFK
jgi:hypothetical protein